MKMTKNRKLILKIIKEDMCGDMPPHSVSNIMYVFDAGSWLNIEACKKYYQIDTIPSRKQVERTIRDLWSNGYIVANRVFADWNNQGLPYWERRYQLSTDIERNYIITTSENLHRRAKKAKYGFSMFGGPPFGYGLLPDEVITLKSEIKALLQRCHPDKASGYDFEVTQLTKALKLIKSGIPVPTDDGSTIEKEPVVKGLK